MLQSSFTCRHLSFLVVIWLTGEVVQDLLVIYEAINADIYYGKFLISDKINHYKT